MSSTANFEIQSFIDQQPLETQQLCHYYCDLLFSMDLNAKIRYKIPFFDHYSWICYLNPVKANGVELAFLYGQELSDEYRILQKKERRQVAGIDLYQIKEVPDQWIKEIIAEAMVLDEYRYQQKKRNH